MHNCKATETRLVELALNELSQNERERLLIELAQCAYCGHEYDSMRNALQIVDSAMQSALPAENFWPGYHSRLRLTIQSHSEKRNHVASSTRQLLVSARRMLGKMMAVSVPAPVAAALILVLGLSTFFAIRSRPESNVVPTVLSTPAETRIVEVPVEKFVTRVVYVNRNQRRPARPSRQATDNADAGLRNARTEMPPSLVGFEPTRDANFRIIKGSYRDEK